MKKKAPGCRLRATAKPTRRAGWGSSAGFTLVEMLVAVSLVVLVMTMFAQVFRTASNLITRQKGMAENGQRARMLTTIIESDLQRRTFRHITPFSPTEPSTPYIDAQNRQGYFYYSENTLESDVDDLLQFTMKVPDDEGQLFGRATFVGAATDTNQPEGDDGQIYLDGANTLTLVDAPNNLYPNSLGASRWAEVSYFVRNGILYRRVLLVREPYDTDPGHMLPAAIDGSVAYAGTFWQDFDYSAFYNGIGPTIHSINAAASALDNTQPVTTNNPLGAPFYRFGHDHANGKSREFTGPTYVFYMGRFTQGETSDPDFAYPGDLTDLDGGGASNDYPTSPSQELGMTRGMVTYPGPDGTIGPGFDPTFEGPRFGEDILLSNVHGFDVKIWDEALGKFVDVGHPEANGSFQKGLSNDLHGTAGIVYGPDSADDQANNRVYDTWHPQLDIDNADGDNDHTTGADPPPYRPVSPVTTLGRDGQYGVAEIDDDGINGIDDAGELGWPGSDDVSLRAIQITIRFFDVSSNQMKQVTLQQSLTE